MPLFTTDLVTSDQRFDEEANDLANSRTCRVEDIRFHEVGRPQVEVKAHLSTDGSSPTNQCETETGDIPVLVKPLETLEQDLSVIVELHAYAVGDWGLERLDRGLEERSQPSSWSAAHAVELKLQGPEGEGLDIKLAERLRQAGREREELSPEFRAGSGPNSPPALSLFRLVKLDPQGTNKVRVEVRFQVLTETEEDHRTAQGRLVTQKRAMLGMSDQPRDIVDSPGSCPSDVCVWGELEYGVEDDDR